MVFFFVVADSAKVFFDFWFFDVDCCDFFFVFVGKLSVAFVEICFFEKEKVFDFGEQIFARVFFFEFEYFIIVVISFVFD